MEWGESRNLKLVRAFLIAFPSAFVFAFFFRALDLIDRFNGGAGVPIAWAAVAVGALAAATWILPVPRPEVLRSPRQGGSLAGWRWRLARAALVAAFVLVVFGGFWEVANRATLAAAGMVSEDWWAARLTFAFLFATASLLFVVEPGEAIAGDLRPWGVPERRAARRLATSLLIGWLLCAPVLVWLALLPGFGVDLAALLTVTFSFVTFVGLTAFVLWTLVEATPRSVPQTDKET